MKRMRCLALGASLVWGLMLPEPVIRQGFANHIVMSIDSSQSQIAPSGTDSLYGAGVPQQFGSDTTTVNGHFLVDFDAVSGGGPTDLQFVGGHGRAAYDLTNNGDPFQPLDLPANFALHGGGGSLALRNLSWDWSSGALPVNASGQFASSGMQFNVISGTEDVENANLGNVTFYLSGISDTLAATTSTLIQTAPGVWQLSVNVSYARTSTISGFGITTESLTSNYNGTIVATANFGADNLTVVDPNTSTQADVLGGSTQIGGVSATFSPFANIGEFSAQQIPFAGLSNGASAAAMTNPTFLLSTQNFAARRRSGTCSTAVI